MQISVVSPLFFGGDVSRLTKLISIGLLLTILGFFLPISSKAGNNIFYALVLLPFIISIFTKERGSYSAGELTPWFIFFVITMSIFAFQDAPLKAVKYAIYLISFWFVISSLVSRRIIDSDRLALWLMTISLVFSLTLLFTHFIINGEPLYSRPNFWATWRFGNPIHVCMLLVCFSVIGVAALPKRFQLPIGVIVILASLVIQSLFQTRSGIAGLLAAGLFLLLVLLVNRANIGKTVFVIVFIMFFGLILLYQMDIFDILVDRGGSYRLELYKITLSEYLSCNLLTGCGYKYDFQSTLNGGGRIAHPHSIYSSLLLYLGPVSLISFLALLIRAFFINYRVTSPWFYGVVASSAFFIVDGKLILDNINITWACLVLPLAIIDGQTKFRESEK